MTAVAYPPSELQSRVSWAFGFKRVQRRSTLLVHVVLAVQGDIADSDCIEVSVNDIERWAKISPALRARGLKELINLGALQIERYPTTKETSGAYRLLFPTPRLVVAEPEPEPLERYDPLAGHRIPLPRHVRARVLERGGRRCAECLSPDELEIDHIVPVAKGGTDDDANLQVLCRPCNSRKGAR